MIFSTKHFTQIYVHLPSLLNFGFQQLPWHLFWKCKESCYLLVLEIGKLRWTSCCRPELNLRASLLFLGQNQFYLLPWYLITVYEIQCRFQGQGSENVRKRTRKGKRESAGLLLGIEKSRLDSFLRLWQVYLGSKYPSQSLVGVRVGTQGKGQNQVITTSSCHHKP